MPEDWATSGVQVRYVRPEMQIRKADIGDAPRCVELAELRRTEYEEYEPRFWKKSPNSSGASLLWFETLFGDGRSLSFVAEEDGQIVGFVIAREIPTPPVYDPGGPTALVDDFCVDAKNRWKDVGRALLQETRSALKERGFAQVVVVGARRDLEKTEFLAEAGLSLASTWWTSDV